MYDDFELTEEQRAIQTLAREFAQKHIKPIAAKIDRMENLEESFPWDMLKEAHKIGLKTLALPKEYGGEEADYLTQIVIIDELAFVDATCSKTISQCWKIPQQIVNFGTEDQRDRFLTAMRDEPTYMIASATTEPDWGSDNQLPYEGPEGGLKLSVERKGDGYVLNGIKHFTALGGVASLYIVSGRTDRTVPVNKGTSKFLIPHDTPGFSVARFHDKVGFRAYPNAELAFEDVYVPKENLLGGKKNLGTGGGPSAGQTNIELAATAMGITRAAYEAALDYAKQRVQGGKPIIEHQLIAGLLADMYMYLQAGRSLLWQTAWFGNHRKMDQRLSLSCARFADKVVRKVTQDALSIFGGSGVMTELPMEKYVRDSLIFTHLASGSMRQAKVGKLLRRD
ncbi:acyl-CoA dehydrogenase family protein [Chloroflexota bacterium]